MGVSGSGWGVRALGDCTIPAKGTTTGGLPDVANRSTPDIEADGGMLPLIMLILALPVPAFVGLPAVVETAGSCPGARDIAEATGVGGCRCAWIADWILVSIPERSPCNEDAIAVCID